MLTPKFQSTRPVWGATVLVCPTMLESLFQSTRPVWGATTNGVNLCMTSKISIHAPRVGRDKRRQLFAGARKRISIHAPRVGRDWFKYSGLFIVHQFQSTRPVWGATFLDDAVETRIGISIHAPRVGRDEEIVFYKPAVAIFQSTRPVWGATANLTILPRQICTKGTKEFLLGRKTHGKKEK